MKAPITILTVLTLLGGAAPAMAIPTSGPLQPSPTVQPAPSTTQGIIMRDGGVCDPIRHMGC